MSRQLRFGVIGFVGVVIVGSPACSEPDWAGEGAGSSPASSDAKSSSADDTCIEETSDAPAGPSTGGGGGDKAGIDVDISKLEACCTDKGQAHCVPEAKVPASTRSSLSTCPSGGYCIPDSIIEGKTPKKCDSGYGDGVCVSLCVKAVAEKASLLKQVTCATNEVCAPCISPLDGKPTGACELGGGGAKTASTPSGQPSAKKGTPCPKKPSSPTTPQAPSSDAGGGGSSPPSAPPAGAAECCGGKGLCVASTVVPAAQRDRLEQKECADAKLCAPKENIDKNFKPAACTGKSVTGSYTGVCLSNCIKLDFLESIASSQGSCDADHRCLPCKTPFGTSTGAPGCP